MHLHDLFAIGRERDPSRAAIVWTPTGDSAVGREVFSYARLFGEAEHVAAVLRGQGLGRGDRVVLFLGNRPELVIAFLAVLRLGAVVVPMNLAYRRNEIEHILDDAQPRMIVTEAEQRSVLAELDELGPVELVVDVDEWDRRTEGAATEVLAPLVLDGSQLAMLLYTSGTTGRSKGAMLSHDNLLATITGLLAAWGWSPQDSLLLTLPLFHTHGLVVGLTCALAAGATVHLRRRFEADLVWRELQSGEVSLFFGVPTMYTRLLASARGAVPISLDSMRLFCCGSAPLAAEVLEAFRERTGHTILERYGMTETGMNLSNPLVGERRAGTVGTPLPGVSARIVDGHDVAVADGLEGDLQVRGGNVFGGYWRDPDKTREAFVADESGWLWFRTGDLARRDPANGAITLLGRRHELVISGGFNIYPREIEEVLCELPGIREAAVVGRAHPEWGEVPVAYLVVDGEVDLEAVQTSCRARIASFKVPKQMVVVESLPRNALGKVLKHLL